MSALDEPVTGQDLVNLLHWVVIETVAATSPSNEVADERLEDIAGHFLALANALPRDARLTPLLLGLAANLIQTEEGAA